MASARARKLALAADTFGGRVLSKPLSVEESSTALNDVRSCATPRTASTSLRNEKSRLLAKVRLFAAFSSPGRRAAPGAQTLSRVQQLLCRGVGTFFERHASSARVPCSRTNTRTLGVLAYRVYDYGNSVDIIVRNSVRGRRPLTIQTPNRCSVLLFDLRF